ncbi:DMT family transporter [Oceanicola sp. 502str15]|uniref:DMT family transporter n=1 Tax=Oceanicola sp. 502str15 TaxID=2696061 RepID=UPI002094C0A5|nr:DMT family transporter [Oceanicola sp. 502str15]MCO6383868.1 EamA family transporter [Oceanicola sp. 502str15]
MTDQSPNNTKGALLALLAYAIFSTHDVVVKYLGESYSPFQIVFFSTLIGFPLAVFMLMRDASDGNLRPKHPWWVALRTVSTVVTGVTVFYAFSVLPMAQTYAILFASPLLITILAIPILGETVRFRRWAAVIVGLCGVMVVLRPGSTPLDLGHLAAIVGALFHALSSIVVRKIGQDERSVVILLYPMMANFVVMACAMPFFYEPMPAIDLGGLGVIAVFAFVATGIMIVAYKVGEAVIVAPMHYSQIIWAAIFGYFIFGESLDRWTVVGTLIIMASGLYIVLREGRSTASENTPVLRTRTRHDTGTSLRLGPLLRRSQKSPSAG